MQPTFSGREHEGDGLNRRDFISRLAVTASAWPLAARAQQPAMPVIGVLSAEWPDLFTDRLRSFRDGLSETGYVEDETWPSNIAGQRAETIACRHWRLTSFVVR